MFSFLRFALLCALACLAFQAPVQAQIAPPRPVLGACNDTCPWVQGASNFSRHCTGLPRTCAAGACSCQDVIGEAKWNGREWRGAFHECYCVPPEVAIGPMRTYLWWNLYYEWVVYKRPITASASEHVFDFQSDDTSFVHFFDLAARRQNGTLMDSTVLFDVEHGFSGTIVFEETGEVGPNPGEEYWRVKSIEGRVGGAPLLTYMTGENRIELLPNQEAKVLYDQVNQLITSVVEVQCRVTNQLFPSGLSFGVEIYLEQRNGGWLARGRGRAGFPPALTHNYDAINRTATFEIRNATPSSAVVLALRSGCRGDVNRDHVVDSDDVSAVEEAFGAYSSPGESPADVNYDSLVDDVDYELVRAQLGCSDGGSTAIPGCLWPTDFAVEQVLVVTTDDTGFGTLTLPAPGAPFSVVYLQVADLTSCRTSNVVRLVAR